MLRNGPEMLSLRRCARELGRMPSMWWQALDEPEGVRGRVRMRTANTSYGLFERRCEEVVALRAVPSKVSLSVMGMTLVGWVFPEYRRIQVHSCWRPGAYAVFWRDGSGSHGAKFALTTATVALE